MDHPAAAAADLNERGVSHQRGVCSPELCATFLAEALDSVDHMLTLPQTMAETLRGSSDRHFVRYLTAAAANAPEASHRSGFCRPFTASVEAVIRSVLSGGVGAMLVRELGRDALLCELTAITSEPGAAAQSIHSDATWSATAPRLITMFLALHDVADASLGPTHFVEETHAPRCFPGEHWLPPTEARVAERRAVWFELYAGDAVLMDSTAWHGGGANTSEHRRTLLAMSFVQPTAAATTGTAPAGVGGVGGAEDTLRLRDLL